MIYRSGPEWIELAAREHKTDVELVIARRPPIRIYGVVRELDRSPVEDAIVTLSFGMPSRGFDRGGRGGRFRGMMQRFASEMPQDETLTDANGKYEFFLSFGGPRHIEAYKDDFYARPEGTADLMINPQVQEYELNFVLFPGSTLHGKVYREDTGEPIPKVNIRLRSRERNDASGRWNRGSSRYDKEMETGTDGLYEFTGLAPGVYSLRILETPDEYVTPEEAEEIVIEESKSLVHDLPLRAGLYIQGTVLYSDGQPASGTRLTGYVLEGGRTLSDESDALGEYELTAFPIDCEVRLYVRPLNFPELNPAPFLTERISLRDSLRGLRAQHSGRGEGLDFGKEWRGYSIERAKNRLCF